MSSTSIEWTDTTWNPTRGCSPVSPGCRNCYAEAFAARNLPGSRSPTTGEAFAIIRSDGPHWTGRVELIGSKLLEPLHWKKLRRVFVNSMSDLFHENLPDEAIDRVFAVMALTPHITYQVLTKRAERMREYLTHRLRDINWRTIMRREHNEAVAAIRMHWPLPNVWLGVSVEDQQRADERIPQLLRTPAAKRFVSYEPALEAVDFNKWLACEGHLARTFGNVFLDWGIIGGESGPGARPFHLSWLRSTIRQFKTAGVPLFVKQMGSRPVSDNSEDLVWMTQLDSKGGNWDCWPDWAKVREFPR